MSLKLSRLQALRESILDREIRDVTFACGGSIPINPVLSDAVSTKSNGSDAVSELVQSPCSPPIDIRWDPHDAAVPARQAKITFPLEPSTRGNLNRLLRDVAPATFGLRNQDVYDESYRKATKLDPTQFSSTFNPYELGIIDTIAQTLLPSLRPLEHSRAVKAELYKLNIYSGPSGKFKAHIDTPRSPAQFGSLVVSFPLKHTGGTLEVRHKDKTVSFDWSGDADESEGGPQRISWAAFYSDCEHEVCEVTEGHRLTLTYNLYCARGNGQLGGHAHVLNPSQLPLYEAIHELVHDEEGWKEGGQIGYNCSHVYPHTTGTMAHFITPDNLKGADMILYEIFASLGLKVQFRPVVEDRGYTYDVTGDPPPLVGGSLEFVQWGQLEGWFEEAYDEWALKGGKDYVDYEKVFWLNKFGHKEEQISWIAYGNEAEPAMTYSCLTMIVEIPRGGAAYTGTENEALEEDSKVTEN